MFKNVKCSVFWNNVGKNWNIWTIVAIISNVNLAEKELQWKNAIFYVWMLVAFCKKSNLIKLLRQWEEITANQSKNVAGIQMAGKRCDAQITILLTTINYCCIEKPQTNEHKREEYFSVTVKLRWQNWTFSKFGPKITS